MNSLDNNIEAVLFLKGEPMETGQLAKLFGVGREEIEEALAILEQKLLDRGIRLMRKEGEVSLATSPEASQYTEQLIKEEMDSPLGRASLEVLAVVLYRGPVKRADIDYIRGVNSTFSLRNLLIRGLVEREIDPKDSRSFVYKPSFKALQYLGVSKKENLPDYGLFDQKIEEFIESEEHVS